MNNNVSKRTSSIARGINTSFWLNKLRTFFNLDLIILLVSFGLFGYNSYLTIPQGETITGFTITGEVTKSVVLNLFTDITMYSFPMTEYIIFIGIILAAVGSYQVLNLLFSLTHTGRIRRKDSG